jgi:hypothetical protein
LPSVSNSFPDITIFNDSNSFLEFERDHAEDIIDILDLDEKVLVKHRSLKKDINTLLDNAKETHNVNVAIASAITAYARIEMSKFKNNPDINLYYTDTDSIYIDSPLPEDFVSNTILGKMKLENVLEKAIFLSPKVYCLLTEDGKLIYKIKGLSHDIEFTMNDFENLLYKDTFIKKSQTKWFKNLSEGHISILEQLYTLRVTENKRKLNYSKNNNKDRMGIEPFY